jgi:hypothetical protein
MQIKNLILACILMFSFTAHAREGAYLALAFGSAEFEDGGFNNSPAFKLSVGNDIGNFAYEISYLNMDAFSAEDEVLRDFSDFLGVTVGPIDVIIEGFDISVLGDIPINDRVTLQGRVGMYFWDARFIATFPEFDDTDSFTDDGNDAGFGVGVDYRLAEQVNLHLMYDQYDAFDTDIELLNAGIRIGF